MWLGHWRHVFKWQCLLAREDGQDMVEYALVIALIAVSSTAAMKPMAVLLTTVLSHIATTFTSAVA
jgi:pilus assembly protein Flp/PilA